MKGSGLRRSLFGAIVTAIGALILVLLLLEGILVPYLLRDTTEGVLATAVAQVDENRQALGLERAVENASAECGCRLMVSNVSGLLADSHHEAPRLDANSVQSYEAELSEGPERLFVEASLPAHVTQEIHASVRELLLLSSTLAALVALFLAIVLSRTFVTPARDLTRVADSLAAGDFSARMKDDRRDEFGQIGSALDRMAEQLQDRIDTLRSKQDRLRAVLNAMVEAVFVADPLGRITATNEAFDRLVGSMNGEADVVGRTANEVFKSGPLHEAVRAGRRNESGRVELIFEGQEKAHELNAEVAPLPEGAGVVVVIHDVTELRRADRMRRDFVANASHELRTPLTAIRGFAETLRDGALHDPKAAARFLDVILRHTARLEALVGDLAALSRAESPSQHLDMQLVDVDAAVLEVLRGLSSRAAERGVDFNFVPTAPHVLAWANPRALDQVLINLVDNAIKYAPSETEVSLEITTGDDIVLRVHNDGPGIDKRHHSRLFERFYRVDEGRSRDVGGTGLGLAIVKHLCTRMGAKVHVESGASEGTAFVVTLQAVPSELLDSELPEHASWPPPQS